MAERRMFAKSIIDSDMFLDMPVTAQLLYFHLCMRADDEGFVNNPKRIMRDVRCGDDDMKMLIAKKYILPFDSGVIVIRHWKIHNWIRADRFKASVCEEKKLIMADENKIYERCIPSDIPSDIPHDTLGKYSVGEDSVGECRLGSGDGQTDELQPLIDFYQANIEILTPFKLQDLQGMCEDFGNEWVQKAMEKVAACEQSKRNNKYLRGVLEGWKKDNVPKPWEQKKKAKGKDIANNASLWVNG